MIEVGDTVELVVDPALPEWEGVYEGSRGEVFRVGAGEDPELVIGFAMGPLEYQEVFEHTFRASQVEAV